MQQMILTIEENKPLAPNVYRLRLFGKGMEEQRPGQFINLLLPGRFLRRPISVYDWEEDRVTVVYKTVGHGTEQLAQMKPGERLDMLTGLGNGYDLTKAGERPLLLGGGAGVPPMHLLAKRLKAQGREVTAILGFNTREEVFAEEAFRALSCRVHVATADGSYGEKGFVTDVMPEEYSYVYACGPEPMLRAVHRSVKTSGQFSLEERMGCGFGACMGCSIQTASGPKRICKEGPVFEKEEILWAD